MKTYSLPNYNTIRRSWALDSQIQFVRHGQSTANAEGILAGQMDVPLTTLGEQQAHEIGQKLAERGQPFDIIASSSLQRAEHTAHIIAGELGYTGRIPTMPDLAERNGGDFQGGPLREFYDASNAEIVAAGGESAEDFSKRIRRGVTLLGAFTAGRVLFVGHAEAYRMMLANRLKVLPEEYELLEKPKNAEVYLLPLAYRDQQIHRIITRSFGRK